MSFSSVIWLFDSNDIKVIMKREESLNSIGRFEIGSLKGLLSGTGIKEEALTILTRAPVSSMVNLVGVHLRPRFLRYFLGMIGSNNPLSFFLSFSFFL